MKKLKLFAGIFLSFLFSSTILVASDKTPVKGEITMPENLCWFMPV